MTGTSDIGTKLRSGMSAVRSLARVNRIWRGRPISSRRPSAVGANLGRHQGWRRMPSVPRENFNISRSHGMVSPCTTTEKTTTPKAVIRISLWSGKEGGSASANANASAPRSPPHQRTCCSRIGIAHVESRKSRHSGYTVRARPARTNPMAIKRAFAPTAGNRHGRDPQTNQKKNQGVCDECARTPINAITKERPSGEKIFRFSSSLRTPRLPMRRPAATVASTPEKWKFSASRNEP